jgi:GH24 family phage-related lysozyme (muramidase)
MKNTLLAVIASFAMLFGNNLNTFMEQFDEGVKEILATISLAVIGGAGGFSARTLWNDLNKRPETDQEKAQALEIAKHYSDEDQFRTVADKMIAQFTNTPVLVRPTTHHDVDTGDGVLGARDNLPNQVVGNNIVDFVKTFEGFSPVKYWDVKQWSIGHGTKWDGKTQKISRQQAHDMLKHELAKSRKVVVEFGKKHDYGWNDYEIDALTSFRFNIGSISKLTDNGNRDNATIAKKMLLYDKAKIDGVMKSLQGLTNRRKAESDLFKNGYDTDN